MVVKVLWSEKDDRDRIFAFTDVIDFPAPTAR